MTRASLLTLAATFGRPPAQYAATWRKLASDYRERARRYRDLDDARLAGRCLAHAHTMENP